MKPSMKAALIHSYGEIDQIEIKEISTPLPKSNEVQIAIKYAGVNPVDWKISLGMLKTRMDYEFPIILGWEMSGEISSIGENVAHFQVGDPVYAYCRKDRIHDGTFAEYICLDANNVLPKPSSLSFAQAASIPLCSLTAWQSLFEAMQLQRNENILIHAGAGGVGGFAIQLAKYAGANVITTASEVNHAYVIERGADHVIDYTQENFVEWVHNHYPEGVDFVMDTVGGKTLEMSYDAVKKGGCIVTIAGTIDQDIADKKQLKTEFVFVRPEHHHLQKISELLDAGKLIPPQIQEFSLEDVQLALKMNREGHTRGKIVLKI